MLLLGLANLSDVLLGLPKASWLLAWPQVAWLLYLQASQKPKPGIWALAWLGLAALALGAFLD